MSFDAKVLVTGASGFVGRYLVDKLLKDGYSIGVLLAKTPIPSNWLVDKRIKVFNIDITRQADFSIIPKELEFEAVFHLAAWIPKGDAPSVFEQCTRVNCIGTNNVLQFCIERGVKKIINSSTASVYGEPSPTSCRVSEDAPLHPLSYYGISKLTSELLCERCSQISNIKVIILRYPSIYGLGQNANTVAPVFIKKARASKNLAVFGKGSRLQDFIYVKDVVNANLNALAVHTEGVFNIGSGVGTSMLTLAETVIRVFGSSSRVIFNPNKDEGASGMIMNISKAEKVLGYKVNYDLETGLTEYRQMLVQKE